MSRSRHVKAQHEFVVTAHFVQHLLVAATDEEHARAKATRELRSLSAAREFQITEVEQLTKEGDT